MAGKPKYTNPPATPINQWVRDALAYAGLSFPEAADAMSAAGLGRNYDRSMIQKMTVSRGVRADEAAALSRITGFPQDADVEAADQLSKYLALGPEQRAAVDALIQHLYASRPEGH